MDNNEVKKLNKRQILGYCAGDIFGGGAFTLVGLHYMNFLTDNILIDAAIVGVMLFIGKIWDAIIDPFIGQLSEQVRSKKGKRRIFFFAGIFHILPAFALLWLPLQNTHIVFKCIYFTLAYMLFATSFSLTMVPYHAFLPELTDDLTQRNKISGLRSIFSNASTLIAGTVPATLITIGTKMGMGYLFMGLVLGVFYAIPWLFVFLSTKGLDKINVNEKKEKIKLGNPFKSFFKNAKTVLKNRTFRILLGLYLLSYTAMDIFMAIFIYYVKWFLNMGNLKVFGLGAYTFLLGVFMITELLSVLLYIKLANKIGKRFGFILATSLWAGGALLTLIASPYGTDGFSWIKVIIPTVVMALGAGGVAYLPWSMLPETMDVEELISGEKKDGVYSGFLTFIRQLSQAVAMLIIGIYLDSIDYNIAEITSKLATTLTPEQLIDAQYAGLSDAVRQGIKYFTCFAPFILLILSCVTSFNYPINNKTYWIMKKEIKERNTKEEKDIAVLEKISGIKFENLPKQNRV